MLKARAEAEVSIAVGDITPLPRVLAGIRGFRATAPRVRINCLGGNLFGPNELLLDGKADVLIHHIDQSDPRYEYRPFCEVPIVPVAAPGFVRSRNTRSLKFADLSDYTQCIIRDTALHSKKLHRFVVDDAPHLTVGDQLTKKEAILQGIAWGHMPLFMVEQELADGRLVSLAGRYIKGAVREIVVARLAERQSNLAIERLWRSL